MKTYYFGKDHFAIYRLDGVLAEVYVFENGIWEFSEDIYDCTFKKNLQKISKAEAESLIEEREGELARGIKYHKGTLDAYPKELNDSINAGCYYCLKIFPIEEIREYWEEPNGALVPTCPYCNVDSIIFDNAKKIEGSTDLRNQLKELHKFYFGDLI